MKPDAMRIVVGVKWVPVLSALRFDPETRRLVREGVPGEPSAFDVRALLAAIALRGEHGGEVVAVTMGPPAARDGLVECLALGADRGVHLADPALVGSDTLATARALAAVVRRESPDVVLLGRASVDAETGQVGPELAELLDWPQATAVRRLTLDPANRRFTAEREADDGFETVEGPLPAIVTVAEDIAPERFPTKAERQAAATKPIATLSIADVDLEPSTVGAAGSPTWVAGIERVELARAGEVLAADPDVADPLAALGRLLAARLAARGALAGGAPPPALPAARSHGGAPIWVVVDGASATRELLAKAAELAATLGGRVEAVVLGGLVDGGASSAPVDGGASPAPVDGGASAAPVDGGASRVPGADGGGPDAAVDALAAAGADAVLVADDASLVPYTTEAHAAVLADAIRARAPRLVLLPSTTHGRDLAPRVAARLGLGLTGDAIDLDVDGEGRVRQHKPAFGGAIVAPILSRTRPEMATVRPGMLHPAAPDPSRRAVVERLPVPSVAGRVRVVERRPLADAAGGALDAAAIVLGVGRGVGGPAALPQIVALAERLGAAVAATREVTDAGWLPRQLQVGLTGRAIAPRLYVGLGVSGAMEHVVGLRRAGTIVAVNENPKAAIFKAADLGVVADWAAFLPHLEAALRA